MIYKPTEQSDVNFFKCFTEEKPNQGLYNDLHEIGEEKFNSWFSQSSKVYDVKNANEIEPPKHVLKKIMQEKIFKPAASQCHYNSQMACLLYDELEFYTGLYLRSDGETITHSFCMLKDKIADFTSNFFLISDKYGFNSNYFPYKYIGVQIEKSFLHSKKQDIIKNGYATPYLYEWYLETCKNC